MQVELAYQKSSSFGPCAPLPGSPQNPYGERQICLVPKCRTFGWPGHGRDSPGRPLPPLSPECRMQALGPFLASAVLPTAPLKAVSGLDGELDLNPRSILRGQGVNIVNHGGKLPRPTPAIGTKRLQTAALIHRRGPPRIEHRTVLFNGQFSCSKMGWALERSAILQKEVGNPAQLAAVKQGESKGVQGV